MDVSIIIVNYNTLHVLQPCLDSIAEHTEGVDYEIIVVDNASTDGSREQLSRDQRVTFLPLDENLGFGKANNYGLRAAKGDYIFFLNSDTLLLNNAVKLFHDFALSYSGKLGAMGCVLEDRNGQPVHSYGQFPKMRDDFGKLLWTPVLKGLHLYHAEPPRLPETWMPVDYVTGADLFVSRKVLDECGAFHPAFFMYYEETEMQLRFRRKGYQTVLLRGPRIIHLEGESAKSSMSRFRRDTVRQQRSEYIYFKLSEPRWKYRLYRILHPVLRQTLWLNPHVSFADKRALCKQLFVPVTIDQDEHSD